MRYGFMMIMDITERLTITRAVRLTKLNFCLLTHYVINEDIPFKRSDVVINVLRYCLFLVDINARKYVNNVSLVLLRIFKRIRVYCILSKPAKHRLSSYVDRVTQLRQVGSQRIR